MNFIGIYYKINQFIYKYLWAKKMFDRISKDKKSYNKKMYANAPRSLRICIVFVTILKIFPQRYW